MNRLFLKIYDFFEHRRGIFYVTLVALTAILVFFALRVNYSEQITNFFPDDEEGGKQTMVFKNLKIADRIVVMFSSDDPDRSIECADVFESLLTSNLDESYIKSISSEVGADEINSSIDLIYGNLPIYLSDSDYARIDSLMQGEGIDAQMESNYQQLSSPMGIALRDIILQDPLGISTGKFALLQDFGSSTDYQIYRDHIFSPDMSMMLMIIKPTNDIGNTGANEQLISAIEKTALESVAMGFEDVGVEYFGGPSVAVYNARQIKKDTMLTLNIAIVLIVLFIFVTFRNKWSILLIITPVLFGAIFALAMISLIGSGTISAIAIGAGAAVFGIALSYSIHVIAHSNHTFDPRQIISELAYPLTIGSFTTIGAFLGLLFTKSQLLRDFGLFAALTLIGTTLFCLIFLPHFLRSNGKEKRPGKILRFIEKINSYRYDRNKWLVGVVCAIILVCAFFAGDVRFDSDMMNINYTPDHLKKSEQKLTSMMSGNNGTVLFASASADPNRAYQTYIDTNRKLDSLKTAGVITNYTSAQNLIIPPSVQQERIEKWNEFWGNGRREDLLERVKRSGLKKGFNETAFSSFAQNLETEYQTNLYSEEAEIPVLLEEWVNVTDGLTVYITQVSLPAENKEEAYNCFISSPDVVIVDRGYYANRMAKTINDDFYLTLYIASFLIFGALLLSFGRIELTLLAFMPMFVSWVIILGLMAMLGIEFNVINIILSTFVFGIGDDFSIFIMDGLLTEYKTGKKMLSTHKTAIFFSAVTIIIGLGVLIFAKHPAVRSISVISVLGILTVIVVSYVLQPILFRILITAQTRKGGFPYTLAGILNTLYAFVYFLLGCIVLQVIISTLLIIPVKLQKKKLWLHISVSHFMRIFLRTMITTKWIRLNEGKETFEKPAVIIANHQSFIDILVLLGLHPKLIMVTNSWVWTSPFFGRIVRFADFYHTADGYEKLAERLQPLVDKGYSVVVFPEGTRSADNTIKRFHSGAFYLAEKLKMDIMPIVLFGNGLISSKQQPFYIKKGLLVSKILKRISSEDDSFGTTYRERARKIGRYFRSEYDQVCNEYCRPSNRYFHDALIKNYIYKGPVLEWYMRIKVKMERNYAFFDSIIPRHADIVDVGCGYGPLSYMLSLLSDKRTVLGIDYDAEKITLANHNFSKNDRINFITADAVEYEMPSSDVFILNDVLHYMDFAKQEILLEHCFSNMRPGGVVIVRDGDALETKRHNATKRTEKWSTQIIGFNKTVEELHFTNREKITALAHKAGLSVEYMENDTKTSNKIYLIRHKV